jgi:enoyl-[acyl-carrier protein] reductase I
MTETAMGLMTGKRGLIMGLANDKSIAWGIAKAVADAGAELAFSYQGEQLLKRVKPLAEAGLGSSIVLPCDVGDAEPRRAVRRIGGEWGSLDFVVHAIGFSDKNELRGRYVDTSPANFAMTMDISVYSFTAVCQRAEKMMPNGGSLLTLTYYGAEKVMPHYNVMGVAKAALEASVHVPGRGSGPRRHPRERDLGGHDQDAGGLGHRRFPLHPEVEREQRAPAPDVTQEEVGKSALYLLSDLSSAGVTGEVHHVDAGYNVIGMKNPEAPDMTLGSKNGG